MKLSNYWQQFLNTGRIEDYLSYARCKEQEGLQEGTKDYPAEADERDLGVQQYAGIHMGDRDDTQAGAYRGIR